MKIPYGMARTKSSWWHLLDPEDHTKTLCGHIFEVAAVVELDSPLLVTQACTWSRGDAPTRFVFEHGLDPALLDIRAAWKALGWK